MKWKKQVIAPENIPLLTEKMSKAIKSGDETIEKYRCVYIVKDSSITNILTPYDFIDLEPKPEITKFYIYQVLDT